MSRSFWLAVVGSGFILAAGTFYLRAADKPPKPSPAEVEAREDVRAALKAEASGDNELRARRLASAVATAPELEEANWHLAKVRVGEKWLKLADAEQRFRADAQWAEYCNLREAAEGNPKLLRGLARWCVKAGWEDTARLHYAQLLGRSDLDQGAFKEAITQMDLHYVNGNWTSGEELKAQRKRAYDIDMALRKWRPRVKTLQMAIDGDDYSLGERASKELQAIDDPQAIGPLASFQLDGGDWFCEQAAKLLGKFPQYEATEALVQFAVLSPYSGARDAAIAALKGRPKHDYMSQLIAGLVSPIKTEFSIAVNSRGTIQYKHYLSREDANVRVIDGREVTLTPALWRQRAQALQPTHAPRNRLDIVLAVASNTRDAAMEIESQARFVNLQATTSNRRVFDALEQLADAQVPREVMQWQQWWQDYNQYYWPKQTYYAYEQGTVPYVVGSIASCFLAGTPVRTQTGLTPVESIQAGDRVLAQDQDTGELAYKVVLRTTIRPPTKMARIYTSGDQITTTLGHPFWCNGQGWKMAKELKEGDLLHSLGGAVVVEKVQQGGEDKAYNLVVDDFNTYFVGSAGLLVHDNKFRKPTLAIVPGLLGDGDFAPVVK